MKNKFFIIFVILCISFITPIFADIPTAQFLLVGQGVRAEAMGQSVVAHCFDYSSTYWNPAATALISKPELGLNSSRLPGEMASNLLGFVYPYKKYGFGFRLITQNSSISAYDINGKQLADIRENNNSVNFIVAYRLYNNISVGAGLGSVNMMLGEYYASGSNINIGGLYKSSRFSAGMEIANFGSALAFTKPGEAEGDPESTPKLMRLGASYYFLEKNQLLVTASQEAVFNDEKAGGIGLGAEYYLKKYISLRTGFKLGRDGATRPSFGFGLVYKMFSMDYALMLSPGKLQDTNVQQIGFAVKFGREKEEKAVEEVKKPKEIEKPAKKEKETERMNVAVADLAAKNVSAADASIVSDFIRTELVNSNTFNVIEKANMDKIMAESAFQQTGCTTSECAVQLGKILNVQQMIVGSLSKLMDTYYITVNVVNVETGKILSSYNQDAQSAKELHAACKTLADKISSR